VAERRLRSRVNAGEAGPPETIVFGPFSLDLRAGRLLRGLQPLRLRPKTFAVLRHLVKRPGALVTKDELLDAVWANTAVTENTLTQSIGELRRVLKDDSTPPRFIETVHHRGFRFVAPISSDARAPGSGSAASPSPSFAVGRAAELYRLDEVLSKAKSGQRQLVFVTGEPGIGKTTLIQTFLAGPAASQVLVAGGQAVEQVEAREPYLVVLDALGRLARIADPQHVVGLLRRDAPAWLAQMPWLLEPADAAALRQSLIDVQPERMLRELAVFLEEFSSTATLILALEDLHWSDRSTVELLLMLAQRSEPARLLVIGTYRPAEASVQEHPILRAKQTLQLRHQCTEIALESLARADVQSYLYRRFPQAVFPKALAGLIHAHTDGNPLFMVAVIDQLIARGWLVATDPGWALTVSLETLRLEVPDELREMIRFQFQGMGPADCSLLEAASVSGTTFTAGEIAQAIDGEQLVVERECEHLVRTHRFLRLADDEAMPWERGARQYAFIHALHQRVIYEEIPAERRRRLHLSIAEVLERAPDDLRARNTFRLAAHFERGGDALRAITYLVASAARAQERFAPREAITCLEAALKLTEHLSDARQRRQREIYVRIPLISALNLVYGYASDEVRENCERTCALCEQNGSLPELYEVLYALWYSQQVRAEKGTTRKTTERLLKIAEQLGSEERSLRAASTRGRTALFEANYKETCDTLQALTAAWEKGARASSARVYGLDPLVAAYAFRGMGLWFLGYPDSARRNYRKAVSLAETAKLPFTIAAAHVHAAFIELLCGNAAETFRLADRALALTTEHAFPFWGSLAKSLKGWAQMRLGNTAVGYEEVCAGITLLESNGAKLTKPVLLALLAEGSLHLGKLREALVNVNEGLYLTQTTLDRFYEPELWRLKGELLLARSKYRRKTARSANHNFQAKEAEQCFQRALNIARERSARSLELRAAMSLARLEQIGKQGRRDEARTTLADIYGWFTEGFDTADLKDAKALLDELRA
jgi:DNA-binding winged helix-turn-helix (wHTH) protein/tetratricopeptide (TPR) repeat protein